MIVFGISTCDTCRKVLKENKNAQLHDVRSDGFPIGILERAATEFGKDLLNTRSTTWRGLREDERAQPMLTLIQAHPTLMKRPLIESDGQLYLGWNDATRAALAG